MARITETMPNPSKLEKEVGEEERPLRQTLPPERCPRCDSLNTKFCYYNNYSLAQPRYFCKTCRRYWTKGGALRNVPFGGSCRRGKRMQASPYERLSMPQHHPMPSHLVLGTSMPLAAMISCKDEEGSPQLSMPYDGFCSMGGPPYYGNPSGSQEQPHQVAQPSLFAAAMLGTYGGSASEATHAGIGSSSGDEHRRLGASVGTSAGGRYPSLLPSPYFDKKNLYFVKDV